MARKRSPAQSRRTQKAGDKLQSTAKPKSQPASRKYTPAELNYLAGFFDGTMNIRGTSTIYAVAVSPNREWLDYLAETYGGKVDSFTAKNGKNYFGWYVDLQRRFELFELLEAADPPVLHIPVEERDKARSKLSKALQQG